MTEFASPRRVTAGDGIEKGILTAGDLRTILDGVNDGIMVVVYQEREHLPGGDYRHVDVVERPDPDPAGDQQCDPDGPQLLVLNLGEWFDTRDY